MKEILLYTAIYDYAAANFIAQLDASKNSDITIRMNTNGGSPESTYGMIAKMAERTKSTNIKVDGKAHSMGAFFLAYATDTEALDVSEILIHRAAYPDYIEKDPEYMTPEMWASLNRTNAKLRAALEAKIDTAKFTGITGRTMDDVFSTSSRIDVLLTAEQAKEIGLINRVVSITPTRKAEIGNAYRIAAQSGQTIEPLLALKEPATQEPLNTKNMTLAEFKAANATLVAELLAEERDRVGAYLVYADTDLAGAIAGIESGKPISSKQTAEWTRKQLSAEFLSASEEGSAAAVTPAKPKAEATAEAQNEEAFFAEVGKLTGSKK